MLTTKMMMITKNQNEEGFVTFHENWGRNIIDNGLKYMYSKNIDCRNDKNVNVKKTKQNPNDFSF